MHGIEMLSPPLPLPLRRSLRLTPTGRGSKPPKTPRHRQDFARVPPPIAPGMLPLTAIALAVTGGAFFLPAVPLWCAGLPLLAAITAWRFTTRFVLALCFFFWPALVATLGLTALGHPALTVSLATTLAVLILPLLMAWLGIVPVSLALLALPTFPANPVPVLADALPGPISLTGLGLILAGLLVVERITPPLTRIFLTVLFCAGLGLGHLFAAIYADRSATHSSPKGAQATWIEHPVPSSITERAAWIRIRDSLPDGTEAILGENLFAQGDLEALAFWRQAARDRNLTLWVGIQAQNGRGTLLRLSPEMTSINPEPVAAARYGIPGITGTWGQMPPLDGKPGETEDIDTAVDWLFCYEALLPRAWIPLLNSGQSRNRPVVVLANDRWLGSLPFHVTRRKVARAMAGMAGRPVHFAETGRTILLRTPEGDTDELE